MNLMSWNPFREMDELLGHSRFLGRAWPFEADGDVPLAHWAPSVDISETDKEYLVKAELPGVKKEDVKITAHNGVLTIEGERKVEHETKDEKHHRVERYYGKFSRSFTLPEGVAADRISADGKEGVITVHLPKSEVKKPKAIEVKVN
jgi:HSP20 family protein